MKKRIVKIVICVVLLAATLFLLQKLLVPKYATTNEEGILSSEYYANAGNNDVLFIGDCEVYTNFSPVKLWRDYGITSYIRGTPQQLTWQSYYLLEDTLRYETPKVVVFNVLAMKYAEPQNEAYNRLTLDGMKWSRTKLDAVKASMTDEETVASYIFPLLRFHSRWNELSSEDINYLFRTEKLSHNGYLMRVDAKPAGQVPDPVPLPDYTIGHKCWEYLDKIRETCEQKGIKLVLIKAPSLYPAWYDQWDKQVVEYAAKYGLEYINFYTLADETGIDYNTDTYDAGLHLNLSGAEKLSAWFGKYLKEKCGVEDRRSDAALAAEWAEREEFYEFMKEAQYKQLREEGAVTRYK
ncbi:MAG: SGNH/GDSL hydrolase family protein [Firmicutes bacterium]|nr:SGNH/GDSL hydrolase family protein [Bacillota bacterium]